MSHKSLFFIILKILEYITAEILELAGTYTTKVKRTRVTLEFIETVVREDKELNRLFNC